MQFRFLNPLLTYILNPFLNISRYHSPMGAFISTVGKCILTWKRTNNIQFRFLFDVLVDIFLYARISPLFYLFCLFLFLLDFSLGRTFDAWFTSWLTQCWKFLVFFVKVIWRICIMYSRCLVWILFENISKGFQLYEIIKIAETVI